MDRLVHVSQTALFFCPASLALSVSSIPSKYKEGKKKKKVSLNGNYGNYHLLMIGLRLAETRLACDLHSSSLELWSIQRKKPAVGFKTLGHCRHLLFLVLLVRLAFLFVCFLFLFSLQL